MCMFQFVFACVMEVDGVTSNGDVSTVTAIKIEKKLKQNSCNSQII
jgi:hypothetical protein